MDASPGVADLVEEWCASLELAGAAAATCASYRAHLCGVTADLESALGRTPLLTDCTRQGLRSALLAYQRGPDRRVREEGRPALPRSRRSVEARLTALRAFSRWCVGEEHLALDPTRGLALPRTSTSTPPRLLSLADARLLTESTAASRSPARDRLLLALTLGSGCAVGEVAALRVCDLDLGARTLTITSKRTRAGARVRVLRPSPATLEAARRYLPVRARVLTRAGAESEVLLLTGSEDLVTRTRSLSRHIERLGTRCGLEVSSHTLRASWAHLALEAGASVREVQTSLGVSLPALRAMLPLPEGVVGVSAHPLG